MDLVPNPPSQYCSPAQVDLDVAQTKHLEFNDSRNKALLGDGWIKELAGKPGDIKYVIALIWG